uniref:Uncharacterized protein n=1 Tax=Ciona intestinalis TaxID=7719 RepID=H2XV42_CIOIN
MVITNNLLKHYCKDLFFLRNMIRKNTDQIFCRLGMV